MAKYLLRVFFTQFHLRFFYLWTIIESSMEDKNTFTELPENTRAKIIHEAHHKVNRVDYSSDDILDSTMAGSENNLFTNIKEPDPDFKEELQKTRSTLRDRILSPFRYLFAKERRAVSISVICGILAAITLLVMPNVILSIRNANKAATDPNAINPTTGFTNRETDWLEYTNSIRSTVAVMSSGEATEPEEQVIRFFEQQLEENEGVAPQMDIRVIWSEYYEGLGRAEEALNVLLATDLDYDQPADDDPDIDAYFNRFSRYYQALWFAYYYMGDTAMASHISKLAGEIENERARIHSLGADPEVEEIDEYIEGAKG